MQKTGLLVLIFLSGLYTHRGFSASHSSDAFPCEKIIKKNSRGYSAAIAELAQGYISLEKMIIESNSIVTFTHLKKALTEKQTLLIAKIGEEKFKEELDKAIKKKTKALDEKNIVRRQKQIKEITELTPFTDHFNLALKQIFLTKDGRRFIGVSHDLKIAMYSMDDGRELFKFDYPFTNAYAIKLSPDERFLALIDMDGKLNIWNAQTGEFINRKHITSVILQGIEFSPDGEHIAGFDSLGTVYLLERESGIIQFFRETERDFRSTGLAFSPNGEQLLHTYAPSNLLANQVAEIWNTKTGESELKITRKNKVRSAQWQPNGSNILLQYYKRAEVIDTKAKIYRPYNWHDSSTFSLDGKLFAGHQIKNADTSSLMILEMESRKILQRTPFKNCTPNPNVNSIGISPDNKKIFVVCKDAAIIVWDMSSYRVADTIEGIYEYATWSLDGHTIIGTDKDGSAHFFRKVAQDTEN